METRASNKYSNHFPLLYFFSFNYYYWIDHVFFGFYRSMLVINVLILYWIDLACLISISAESTAVQIGYIIPILSANSQGYVLASKNFSIAWSAESIMIIFFLYKKKPKRRFWEKEVTLIMGKRSSFHPLEINSNFVRGFWRTSASMHLLHS